MLLVLLANAKHCIVCASRDSMWDCIRTTRPTLDSQFSFQLFNWDQVRETRSWKVEAFGFPSNIEQPKYLPNDSDLVILKVPDTIYL